MDLLPVYTGTEYRTITVGYEYGTSIIQNSLRLALLQVLWRYGVLYGSTDRRTGIYICGCHRRFVRLPVCPRTEYSNSSLLVPVLFI